MALPRKLLCKYRTKKKEARKWSIRERVKQLKKTTELLFWSHHRGDSNKHKPFAKYNSETSENKFLFCLPLIRFLSFLCSDNMCLLQAQYEHGVSAHENWVMAREVGDEPIGNEERWSTFLGYAHVPSFLNRNGQIRARLLTPTVLHLHVTPSTWKLV